MKKVSDGSVSGKEKTKLFTHKTNWRIIWENSFSFQIVPHQRHNTWHRCHQKRTFYQGKDVILKGYSSHPCKSDSLVVLHTSLNYFLAYLYSSGQTILHINFCVQRELAMSIYGFRNCQKSLTGYRNQGLFKKNFCRHSVQNIVQSLDNNLSLSEP